MRLFDFFNREKSPSDPKDRLKQRWLYLSDGLIKDNNSAKVNHYVARFSTNVFDTWFLGLEQRLGQSLGRRLAHAALEHQEFFLKNSGVKIPSSRDPKNWTENILDWQTRGLGVYSKLEDEDEVRMLVESPASSPICSGLITSTWEVSTTRSKKCYSVKGGSTLEISDPKEYDLKDGNIEDGYINFAVLKFSFNNLEFLHLKSSGHRRALHSWNESFASTWLVP